jgi:hypothetical protein
VLFYGEISPEVERKFVPPYFSLILEEPPIKVFELNRTLVPLNFAELTDGTVDERSLCYVNPDVLEFTLVNCSENAQLMIKMNYHEGWKAYCNSKVVPCIRSEEGFINLTIPLKGDVQIKLQYGSTLIDYTAIGTTLVGGLTCFFTVLGGFSRVQMIAKLLLLKRKTGRHSRLPP